MVQSALAKDIEPGVIVLQSKKVDYYDVNVVKARTSEDLVTWFNNNNYTYPEDYAYVLDHYIDKKWYFTAIKVDVGSLGATAVQQDLKEGHPTPVKLVFSSTKIVFPLKISSVEFKPKDQFGPASDSPVGSRRKNSQGKYFAKISMDTSEANWCNYELGEWCVSDEIVDTWPGGIDSQYRSYRSTYIPIRLYVIADGKYQADYFNADYANWVSKKDIEDLGYDDSGDPYIQPKEGKYFITSLYSSMQKGQMDEDVILRKADDNRKVNAGPEAWEMFVYGLIIGIILFITWVFTPLGIMFVAGCLVIFLARDRGIRILGWVIEIVSLVITLLIGFILLILTLGYGTVTDYVVASMLITLGLICLIMLIIILIQVRVRRGKNNVKRR
jgi:hypothetical protein